MLLSIVVANVCEREFLIYQIRFSEAGKKIARYVTTINVIFNNFQINT
jgi:hypothetical protein